MKSKTAKRTPNPAAEALKETKFRQRIVKAKKTAYSRKNKHKKGEPSEDGFPFSGSGIPFSAMLLPKSHTVEEKLAPVAAKQ